MKLNIWMHSMYQFDNKEYAWMNDHTALDGDLDILNIDETYINGGEVGVFHGQTYIRRHESMIGKGTMLKVHSTYDDTPAGNRATFVHFYFNNWYFDNRTTNDNDVCLEAGTKCLLMCIDGHIINSLSDNKNKEYYGIGMVLDGRDDVSLNWRGAVELGAIVANQPSGAVTISGCKIGIDQRNGVTRFKISNPNHPYDLSDNFIAINVHPGTYVSKWAYDISGVNSKQVVITLAEADKWHAGDVVFASGFSNERGTGLNCPLDEGDLARIDYLDELTRKRYKRSFDNSVSPSPALDDPTNIYPCIRLSGGIIYNMTKGGKNWYRQLAEAVDAANAGDELVYFGNVTEETDVVINKNLTIRAASENNPGDVTLATSEGFDVMPAGYIADKTANGSFITVTNGAIVNLGGTNSGPLTFRCNGKGRGVDVQNGTLNVGLNAAITGGYATVGGGIYANTAAAQVNLAATGNKVYNNKASSQGDDIYVSASAKLTIGAVADGLLLEPCECSVIDGWYEDAEGSNRWVGHNPAGEYHLVPVTETPTGSAYALKAAHGEPSVKVNWTNYDNSVIKSEFVKIGTTPEYTGTTPFRPSTPAESFTFTGWSPDPSEVTVVESHGEYTFQAQYESETRKADVIFYDFDRTILQQTNCAYGGTPEYTGEKDPTKPSTSGKRYVWDGGWEPALAPVMDVTKTYEYSPTFTEISTYTITFLDAEGEVFEQFTDVDYGVYTPTPANNPTRENYIFDDWKDLNEKVRRDATYEPTWKGAPHTVTYLDEFGHTYWTSEECEYGTAMPDAPEVTHPDHVTDGDVDDYDFVSWTCSDTPAPTTVPDHDVTFTANWKTFFHVHVGDIDNRIGLDQAGKDGFDVTLPIDKVLAYPPNTIYAGLWTDSSKSVVKSDVCGKEVPVTQVSQHIYVREISDCYAKPYVLSVSNKGVYTSMLMAAIDVNATEDSIPYVKAGFLFRNAADSETVDDINGSELYSKVNVTVNGKPSNSYGSKNCGCPEGMMLFCKTLSPEWIQAKKGVDLVLHPYFVTQDGVRVYAVSQKDMTFKVTAAPRRDTVDCAPVTEKEAVSFSADGGYGQELLPMLRLETFSLGEAAADDVVLTLHVDGLDSVVSGEAGSDFRALAGTPVLEGSLFAGWYLDEEFTIPADLSKVDSDQDVYARFVKADGLLELRVSTSCVRGRLVRVRLSSACHEDMDAACGFRIECGGNISTRTAECFRAIDGATAASLFKADEAMLFYCDLPVAGLDAADELRITPLWTTPDGSQVCGKSVSVELK